MTEQERDDLRAESKRLKKYMAENEWLYLEDGTAVVFEKTYLKKMNMMGWVYDQEDKKYIRTKRIIWSKLWQKVHNLVAHPMLAIYRPWGVWLHEYTAEKMYKGPQRVEDEDTKITAVMD